MNYEAAFKEMEKGIKVAQGAFIYFLGKENKNEPYTLRLRSGRTPLVISGFYRINKKGSFALTTQYPAK